MIASKMSLSNLVQVVSLLPVHQPLLLLFQQTLLPHLFLFPSVDILDKQLHNLTVPSNLPTLLLQIPSFVRIPYMGPHKLSRVTETNFFLKVLVQLAVVFAFLFTGFFLVRVGLVDDKILREDVKVDS